MSGGLDQLQNAVKVFVGVYVGEVAEDEEILSSTRCEIPCSLSVRCGNPRANADTGEHYTNEAKGYAAQAQTAMENIEQYKGLEEIGTFVWSGDFYLESCYSDGGGEATGYHYFPRYLVDAEFVSMLKQARFAHVHLRGEYADFNGIITVGTVYHSGYHGLYEAYQGA